MMWGRLRMHEFDSVEKQRGQSTAHAARPLADSSEPEGRATLRGQVGVALALLAVYIIWGSTYLGIRFTLESFPPFLMAGTRFLLAGTLLYLVLRMRGAPAPTRSQWVSSALIGALLLVTGNGVVVFAEQWITSGLTA